MFCSENGRDIPRKKKEKVLFPLPEELKSPKYIRVYVNSKTH